MKLIAGLGNPGKKYENNRHNVGFMVVRAMAGGKKWGKSKSGLFEYVWLKQWGEVELMKPLTYMNKSGDAIGYVYSRHSELKVEDLWVIHDDLDIPLGKFKIQQGRGPKQHNGIDSIERVLGSKDFWRVRVGVENRQVDIPGDKYVLSDFQKDEIGILSEVIKNVAFELKRRINGSV